MTTKPFPEDWCIITLKMTPFERAKLAVKEGYTTQEQVDNHFKFMAPWYYEKQRRMHEEMSDSTPPKQKIHS